MKKAIINQYNHLITAFGIGLFLFSIALYMYFLSLSVMHVVMRREAVQDLNELKSEIARLETSYIEARHNINSKLADIGDFNHNQEKIFIKRGESSLVLNSNE